MRLGLLVCDHVRPEFLPVAGDYEEMFKELFAGNDVELTPFDLTTFDYPQRLDEFDGFISTGSRASVYEEEPWIQGFAELVRRLHDEGRRFVGICFGQQMMAQALGGKVARSEIGWGVGIKEVDVLVREPWMEPSVVSFRVLNSHRDQVVQLPDDARILGESDHCSVSMMAIGSHFLGIQGHPEFVPEFSAALMRARRGVLIPEEVADAGLASLTQAPDRQLLAAWITRFIAPP